MLTRPPGWQAFGVAPQPDWNSPEPENEPQNRKAFLLGGMPVVN